MTREGETSPRPRLTSRTGGKEGRLIFRNSNMQSDCRGNYRGSAPSPSESSFSPPPPLKIFHLFIPCLLSIPTIIQSSPGFCFVKFHAILTSVFRSCRNNRNEKVPWIDAGVNLAGLGKMKSFLARAILTGRLVGLVCFRVYVGEISRREKFWTNLRFAGLSMYHARSFACAL